jgi:hypothetical protein
MNILTSLRSRLRPIFKRKHLESEMDAELRFHVDAYAAEFERAGVPPEEARRRA